MRLQKFMAMVGIASRRKCEEYISAGMVLVNGLPASLGCCVDPQNDRVEFSGKVLKPQAETVLIAFYKPRHVLCASSDARQRKTTSDFFRHMPYRLYNIGRLDYDSEGLLLMTNDGDLAYQLSHPKFNIEKEYYVVCDGQLSDAERAALENGLEIGDGVTAPARVACVNKSESSTAFLLTIHEGRNRQIRRMLEAIGHQTLLLRRVRIGSVRLGALKSGEWRLLQKSEYPA